MPGFLYRIGQGGSFGGRFMCIAVVCGGRSGIMAAANGCVHARTADFDTRTLPFFCTNVQFDEKPIDINLLAYENSLSPGSANRCFDGLRVGFGLRMRLYHNVRQVEVARRGKVRMEPVLAGRLWPGLAKRLK